MRDSTQQKLEEVKLRMKQILDISDELKYLYEDNKKLIIKNNSILESVESLKQENIEAEKMIEILLERNKQVSRDKTIKTELGNRPGEKSAREGASVGAKEGRSD